MNFRKTILFTSALFLLLGFIFLNSANFSKISVRAATCGVDYCDTSCESHCGCSGDCPSIAECCYANMDWDADGCCCQYQSYSCYDWCCGPSEPTNTPTPSPTPTSTPTPTPTLTPTPTPTPTPVPRSVSGEVYCEDDSGKYELDGWQMRILRSNLGNTTATTNTSGTFLADLTGESQFSVRLPNPIPGGELSTGVAYEYMGLPEIFTKSYCDSGYETCDATYTTNHTGFDFKYSICSCSENILLFEDENAGPSGNVCSGNTVDTEVTLAAGNEVFLTDPGNEDNIIGSHDFGIVATHDVHIYPSVCGEGFDVTLELDENGDYICACGASINSPYICQYFNVESDYLTLEESPIEFFLKKAEKNDAWFQTAGGNIWSVGRIYSPIPYHNSEGPCLTSSACEPALVSLNPWASGNPNTPGFPLTESTSIDTYRDAGDQQFHIHTAVSRSMADDGNARRLPESLEERNYNYYYNKFGFSYEGSSNLSGLPYADLPDSLTTGDELNVFFADGGLNISDANTWEVPPNTKVVVFVNGNLNFQQGTDNRLTQVPVGSFLGFIVSGNVNINRTVGYTPPQNDEPLEAFALPNEFYAVDGVVPNLEGVFIADGAISTGTYGNEIRDNKFIGAGIFAGWGGISLDRDFDDGVLGKVLHSYNSTETFIHRPDLLINMPVEMKEALHEWREVQPSRNTEAAS